MPLIVSCEGCNAPSVWKLTGNIVTDYMSDYLLMSEQGLHGISDVACGLFSVNSVTVSDIHKETVELK